MDVVRLPATLVISALGVCAGACGHGEGPFRQVQFCLASGAGTPQLKQALQQIAREEHMTFTDGSSQTQSDLNHMKDALPSSVVRSFPIINVDVRRGNVGMGGTNLGLGSNQVVMGFGPNTPEGRAFADRVIRRLQQRWKLVDVPGDRGAFPLTDCPKG